MVKVMTILSMKQLVPVKVKKQRDHPRQKGESGNTECEDGETFALIDAGLVSNNSLTANIRNIICMMKR